MFATKIVIETIATARAQLAIHEIKVFTKKKDRGRMTTTVIAVVLAVNHLGLQCTIKAKVNE